MFARRCIAERNTLQRRAAPLGPRPFRDTLSLPYVSFRIHRRLRPSVHVPLIVFPSAGWGLQQKRDYIRELRANSQCGYAVVGRPPFPRRTRAAPVLLDLFETFQIRPANVSNLRRAGTAGTIFRVRRNTLPRRLRGLLDILAKHPPE